MIRNAHCISSLTGLKNTGSDRSQLANVAREAKAVLQVDKLEAVADRGYFNGEEILACEQSGICVTLPKPMTSGAKAEGRFGKQDFVYMPEEDVYRCPAGEKLIFHYANEEHGQKMRRYWTNACKTCAIKEQCTTGKERRITRWEHEHVLETVSSGWIKILRPCAAGARRLSIPSVRSR